MFPTLEERSVLVVDHMYKQTKLFIHLSFCFIPPIFEAAYNNVYFNMNK